MILENAYWQANNNRRVHIQTRINNCEWKRKLINFHTSLYWTPSSIININISITRPHVLKGFQVKIKTEIYFSRQLEQKKRAFHYLFRWSRQFSISLSFSLSLSLHLSIFSCLDSFCWKYWNAWRNLNNNNNKHYDKY